MTSAEVTSARVQLDRFGTYFIETRNLALGRDWTPISDHYYKGDRRVTLRNCEIRWPAYEFRCIPPLTETVISV